MAPEFGPDDDAAPDGPVFVGAALEAIGDVGADDAVVPAAVEVAGVSALWCFDVHAADISTAATASATGALRRAVRRGMRSAFPNRL